MYKPRPALSKREGLKKSEVKVLSFGEDLGEANYAVEELKKNNI
jgi:hypothetical protein